MPSSKLLLLAATTLTIASATLNLTQRGCSTNEVFHAGNVSYGIRNATGSIVTRGFPRDGTPVLDWGWSIGVQQIPGQNAIQQPIWVDTAEKFGGVDLASKDLGFEMCYMAIQGQSQSVQKRGYGDEGDCMKFLSKQCVKDWQKILEEQAFVNSTHGPCSAAASYSPDSCKEFQGMFAISGSLPSANRNCTFGLGDPDYDDVVILSDELSGNGTLNASNIDTSYDEAVTSTVPLFVLGWSKFNGTSQHWASAQIMCLGTSSFEEGSRVTTKVPMLQGS